jgi:hypothetical protein
MTSLIVLADKARRKAKSQERQRYGAEVKLLKIEHLARGIPCTCDKQTMCTKCRIWAILRPTK